MALAVGLTVGLTTAPAAAVAVVVAAAAPPVTDPAPFVSNPFLPENENLSDCISSNPRPNCGSDQRSGYHQYVTLIVLFLGTLFIGWRIARGVRSRDRIQNAPPADTSPQNRPKDRPKV